MLRLATVVLSFGIVLAAAFDVSAADSMPGYVTAAVNDAGRSDGEKRSDADRKPGEMVVFADIKPGSKVVDFFPLYFTRIFSKVVGAKGKIYALGSSGGGVNPFIAAIIADPAYSNVAVITEQAGDFKVPEPVDVVWTSRNYHDLHNMPDGTVAAFNKAVFAVLKPGGVYIVLDHAAAPGSGAETTKTLHRIDPALVKTEVMAAGFKFDSEDNTLRNPADDHTVKVFDLHDKTDQFIYKFRKP